MAHLCIFCSVLYSTTVLHEMALLGRQGPNAVLLLYLGLAWAGPPQLYKLCSAATRVLYTAYWALVDHGKSHAPLQMLQDGCQGCELDMQVFTVTTPTGSDVQHAAAFVRQLCPSARPTYALGGTQKYELPTSEVTIITCCGHLWFCGYSC